MTRNKAQKEQIRARMEETGENYTTARRHILNQPELTVWELGEDGDSWYVEGTLDINAAKLAVKDWLEYTSPEIIDNGWEHYSQRLSTHPSKTYFWKPLFPQYPDEESILLNAAANPEDYEGQPLMQGTLVQDNLDNYNYDQ